MVLKNIMEQFVSDKLSKMMEADGCCTCERCQADAAAIALNMLQPHYIATEQGALFSKAQTMVLQFDTDVLVAISKAIRIVKERPRHPEPVV